MLRGIFMDMKKIISIDPGANGGIMAIDQDGNIQLVRLKKDYQANYDLLAMYTGYHCLLEDVGYAMPGNAAAATATFARHVGHLECALYAHCIDIIYRPLPRAWMKLLGVPTRMAKNDRKKFILERCRQEYPELAASAWWNSDAVGMYIAWRDEEI